MYFRVPVTFSSYWRQRTEPVWPVSTRWCCCSVWEYGINIVNIVNIRNIMNVMNIINIRNIMNIRNNINIRNIRNNINIRNT